MTSTSYERDNRQTGEAAGQVRACRAIEASKLEVARRMVALLRLGFSVP